MSEDPIESPWEVHRCAQAPPDRACGIKLLGAERGESDDDFVVIDTNRDECAHGMRLSDALHVVDAHNQWLGVALPVLRVSGPVTSEQVAQMKRDWEAAEAAAWAAAPTVRAAAGACKTPILDASGMCVSSQLVVPRPGAARRAAGRACLESAALLPDQVWYVAHPVRATEEEVAEGVRQLRSFVGGSPGERERREVGAEVVRRNVGDAKACLARLAREFPSITFVAPWIAALDGGGDDDSDEAARARGLRDCRRVIPRCDGLVLVGGRVSDGMRDESSTARRLVDLTGASYMPPERDFEVTLCAPDLASFKALVADYAAKTAASGALTIEEHLDAVDPVAVDQPPPVARPDRVPVWENVISDFRLRFADNFDGIVDDDSHKYAGEQAPEEVPVPEGRQVQHVLADMRERDRVGRERYGTPLTTGNGRDHLVDAYQELLDASVYLKAAWLEGVQVIAEYNSTLDLVMTTRQILDAVAARRASR